MELAMMLILALLCAALLICLLNLRRGLSGVRRQIKTQMEERSTARVTTPSHDREVEELCRTVNQLLELRQREGVSYRKKEQELREQIANVSHDLRTPLTSILGYLQLLEGELPEEQRREYLSVIRSRAATLQTLITAFYDLSRIEGGEWKLELQPVYLNRELSDLLAASYQQLEEAGIAISVEMAEGLPAVWGDRGAVVRLLSNLLTNALKHGSDYLKIWVGWEEGRLVTAFANGAPGLTPEDADHVFERFYTADRTRSGQNTGLGMAIVKALAERMGHQVSARLENGEFSVRVIWRCVK